jgi:asparagine synthase (glutamine-hydrolysing)
MKTYDGREKSLLRGAAHDLLPASVVQRVKSPYPSTQDSQYVAAIQEQVRGLTALRDHDVFKLLDRGRVSETARQDPAAITAAGRHALELALDLVTWLDIYHPTLSLAGAPATAHPRRAA